jgi:hypothetical protein
MQPAVLRCMQMYVYNVMHVYCCGTRSLTCTPERHPSLCPLLQHAGWQGHGLGNIQQR